MTTHCSWASKLSSDLVPAPVDASGRPTHQVRISAADEAQSWLAIAPVEAHLSPDFSTLFRHYAASRPDVCIFYGDEIEGLRQKNSCQMALKPSLNPALLLAVDYIGFPVLIRASTFKKLGGFRDQMSSAIVYDLLLRALKAGVNIERIPEIMVAYVGPRPRPNLNDRRRALADYIGADEFEIASGRTASSLQLRRVFSDFPPVTLVIPTAQSLQLNTPDESIGSPHIINFLNSVAKSDWPLERIKILIGDDVADDRIYAGGDWPFSVRRIVTSRPPEAPFNYAAKMNALWREADTEFMVLMNDDVVVRDPSWLRALMTFAMDEDVGGVGARLLYGDGRLQHAGIPGGLFGLCAHAWLGCPADAPTYQDWAQVHRDWSMVTGAVFATRRSVLEAVAGFDERFTLEFNDIDLCLRLKLLGYRIVYTPFAELVHYEKSSRREALPNGGEVALFLRRWNEFLGDDPAFHPLLQRDRFDLTPSHTRNAWYDRI